MAVPVARERPGPAAAPGEGWWPRGYTLTPERLLSLCYVAVIVAAGIIVMLLQYGYSSDGYMTDDAFISFRYAQNFADGLGPVWERGNRVEGYTNFGWIMLMAVAAKVGVDPVDSSRVLGFLSTAGTLALLPVLAAQMRPAWSRGWWLLSAGAVLAVGVNPGTALWTFAGLETPGVMFFVTAAMTAHLHEERTQSPPAASAVLLLGAALVRPDAVVLVAITGAFKLARVVRADGSWRDPRRMAQVRQLALWGALFAVPFVTYWLWRWSYYTDFFPNTYYLKSDHSMRMLERGWRYSWDFIGSYGVWLLPVAVLPALRELRAPHLPSLYLSTVVLVMVAYVTDAGGDWMPHFRFFMPVLPAAYVVIVHALIDGGERLAGRAGRDRLAQTAATAGGLAAGALVFGLSVLPTNNATAENPAGFVDNTHILPGSVDNERQRAIGLWLRENIPADYTIAQIATGIVPYYSRLPTIDMLGVNDRHIAHRDIPLGYGAAGHEKEDAGYVISRKPELIWLEMNLEAVPRSTPEDYMPPRYTEWVPVKRNVTDNAYIWLLYRPVAIPIEDGWLNLLVRADVELPVLSNGASR